VRLRAIIDHGRVVMQGAINQLIAAGETGIEVDCDDPARARSLLAGLDGVRSVREAGAGSLHVDVDPTSESAIAINRALVEAGIGVAGLRKTEQTLEQRYLALTAGSTPSEPGSAS
jgi:ABC-type multidrug transport system ATPase subunit